MNRLVATFLAICTSLTIQAQTYSPDYYIYPLEGVSKLYSANFGELRSDHFHSGIDIKTEGVEGKRVVAVADGYVSRISMSPYGYGLALYVAHPNGSTSVYGHLSKFMEPVANYVESERYRSNVNTVNLYCTPSQFPVKQGDVIALSGNSGGSFGPHLHFEIRESVQQEPINVVAQKIITPKDAIAPLIMRVHYIETDNVQGITHKAPRKSFEVAKNQSSYALADDVVVPVGRQGYFVIEASDRRNDVYNTFGIYRLAAWVDGVKFFEYKMDKFLYSNTRYCNAIGYYPLVIKSRNEVLRLSAAENTDKSHYTTLVNKGVITSVAGESREINIDVEDDCGNLSQLKFSIKGKGDDAIFKAQESDPKMLAFYNKPFVYRTDDISVTIPAKALYESVVFSCEVSESADSTILSKIYDVLNVETPLQKAMTISVAADIPKELQSKVGLICISRSGKPSFAGGVYRYGNVVATSRNAGRFYVVADTKAPVLKLKIEEGADLKAAKHFTCSIADDLSGVKSYSATLNGEWIALDLDKGVMRHNFRNAPTGQEHTLVVYAEDGVGNKTEITRNFIR